MHKELTYDLSRSCCNSYNPLRRFWHCWHLFPNQIFPKGLRKMLTNPVKQMKTMIMPPSSSLLLMLLTDTFISLVLLHEITKITTFWNWSTWARDSTMTNLSNWELLQGFRAGATEWVQVLCKLIKFRQTEFGQSRIFFFLINHMMIPWHFLFLWST